MSPYELIVARLAEFLGEPTARSAVNTFCKQKVGVQPTVLTKSQLTMVLPAFRPMLMVLLGTTNTDAVLNRINKELSQ